MLPRGSLTGPLNALTLCNHTIKWLTHSRLLGVTIDNKLTWSQHIFEVKKSFVNKLNLLKRSSFLPRNILLDLYFNPRTYKQINTPPWYKGGGGEVDGSPPRSFRYVPVFWNDFTFSGKPLTFWTRRGIFYGWWRCGRPVTSPTTVAILVAKNWKLG